MEKEKAALVKWLNDLEDETVIRYLSEVRKKKRSFAELRSMIIKDVKVPEKKKKSSAATEKEEHSKMLDFQKSLLSWLEMTDEELEYIQEKRRLLNEWK